MINSNSITRGLTLIEQDSTKVLGLAIGQHTVTPGAFVPKADAQSAPQVSLDASSSSKTYLAVGVDLDAPFQSFSPLSPILHWMQPGFKAVNGSATLQSSQPCLVDYLGPKPPGPSGPHRYVFFLYEQPDAFEAKEFAPPEGQEVGLWPRIRFDLDGWEKTKGLAPAVAVTYFNSN